MCKKNVNAYICVFTMCKSTIFVLLRYLKAYICVFTTCFSIWVVYYDIISSLAVPLNQFSCDVVCFLSSSTSFRICITRLSIIIKINYWLDGFFSEMATLYVKIIILKKRDKSIKIYSSWPYIENSVLFTEIMNCLVFLLFFFLAFINVQTQIARLYEVRVV